MGCIEDNSYEPINFRTINTVSPSNKCFNILIFEE